MSPIITDTLGFSSYLCFISLNPSPVSWGSDHHHLPAYAGMYLRYAFPEPPVIGWGPSLSINILLKDQSLYL